MVGIYFKSIGMADREHNVPWYAKSGSARGSFVLGTLWVLFAVLTFGLAFGRIIPRWEWFMGLFWFAASIFFFVIGAARMRYERTERFL